MASNASRNSSASGRPPGSVSSSLSSSQKPRQLSHLHSQLAQLTAHISDLENLLKVTAVQAESMRGLGGYSGAMFMAASKVLGEETMQQAGHADGQAARLEGDDGAAQAG